MLFLNNQTEDVDKHWRLSLKVNQLAFVSGVPVVGTCFMSLAIDDGQWNTRGTRTPQRDYLKSKTHIDSLVPKYTLEIMKFKQLILIIKFTI